MAPSLGIWRDLVRRVAKHCVGGLLYGEIYQILAKYDELLVFVFWYVLS